MFINVFHINTEDTIAATNDADAVTGNQSVKWGGLNPNAATGATGNVAAASGLSMATENVTNREERVIPKLVQLNMSAGFQAGNPNYFVFPLANLQVGTPKKVYGLLPIGVFDPNSIETGATPTPSVIQIPEAIVFSVVKDRIDVKVPTANIALVEDKYINLIVWFSA